MSSLIFRWLLWEKMHANLLHLMASWGIWPKSDGKQFHIYPGNNKIIKIKYVKLKRIWSQNKAGEKKWINIFKYIL